MATNRIALPRLVKGWNTHPQLLERYWDIAMSRLEKLLNEIVSLPQIQSALAQLRADTDEAQDTANTAMSQSERGLREASLANSYVNGFSGSFITATSSGSITVVDHTRVYGDSVLNPDVQVLGGTFNSGAVSNNRVNVYYDDPDREGGAVTYYVTINPTLPLAQASDRHSVGAVTIPVSGTNTGTYVKPPGYVA